MKIDRTIGEGSEYVYAYYFPSQVKSESFPHKIGKTKSDPIKRIRHQQASMQEAPVIGTLVKCTDCDSLEAMIHLYLNDRRMVETWGDEWFDIHPNAISNCILDGLPSLRWNQQLKYYRLKSGMSQVELAKAAGLRQATVSHVENGYNINIESIAEICRELKLLITFAPADL